MISTPTAGDAGLMIKLLRTVPASVVSVFRTRHDRSTSTTLPWRRRLRREATKRRASTAGASPSGRDSGGARNLALRQQLALFKQTGRRPQLSDADRAFWVVLSRIWARWKGVAVVVKPETVNGWRREGFRRYWTWKSRQRRPGWPLAPGELRDLIRKRSIANPGGERPGSTARFSSLGSPSLRPLSPSSSSVDGSHRPFPRAGGLRHRYSRRTA